MEKNKNKPKLRFPGFNDPWEQRKLGDLGSVVMNRRIFKEQTSNEGDVPFYKIGTFGSEPDAFISRDLFEEYRSKYPYPEKGDILISASGSIGRTVEYMGKDEYFQDSNIVWLQHDNRVINSFLKQFYSVVKWSGLEGSTIKRLYNKNILDTHISLPELEEQIKIGEFFRYIDDLITLHQRKLNHLQDKKKSLLQKMFPKNGEDSPELRFPGFTDPWEQRKLRDVSEIIGGGTPSTSNPEYWNGNIDWYSPTEIGDHVYASGSVKTITQLGLEKSSAKILPSDKTVLFTSRAGIGEMAILKRPGATNQGFQSLVLKNDMDTYFLYSMGHLIKKYAEKNASGSTFLEISGRSLGNMPILVPSINEQTQIGIFFKNIDNLIILHQRKLNHLQEQKKALLQQMFV